MFTNMFKKLKKRLKKLRNWWSLPPKCPKHGRTHLYQHGYEATWDCMKCVREEMGLK